MNDDFFEQARAYFSEKARKPDQKNVSSKTMQFTSFSETLLLHIVGN
jgi:hypothetical protein